MISFKVDKEVLSICETAISSFEKAGVEIIVKDKIWEENPVQAWMVFWACSRAKAQQHLIGTKEYELIDPLLRVFIEMGIDMDGASYASAIDSCHYYNYELEEAFKDSPLIITPATCGQAPKLECDGTVNGEETAAWVDFTMGINMTRNPAGVIPIGLLSNDIPVALQIIGRQRCDLSVLKAMLALETVIQFDKKASDF